LSGIIIIGIKGIQKWDCFNGIGGLNTYYLVAFGKIINLQKAEIDQK
jgi:hypothetical protein